tara:strand:- start:325 stop:486 length:162 start_codon:yes stop_codon:yes gene_type:complete
MLDIDFYELVQFIKFNKLNRDKQIVKQFIDLLSSNDDFSVEKFLNEIEYWEQD